MKINLSDGSSIQITVSKKTMKNIRLRVCRDGRVCVSAPYGTAESRIYEFVNSKKGWIESHIRNFQKAENPNTMQFLGSEYAFEVVKDRRTGVALNGNNITVFFVPIRGSIRKSLKHGGSSRLPKCFRRLLISGILLCAVRKTTASRL